MMTASFTTPVADRPTAPDDHPVDAEGRLTDMLHRHGLYSANRAATLWPTSSVSACSEPDTASTSWIL